MTESLNVNLMELYFTEILNNIYNYKAVVANPTCISSYHSKYVIVIQRIGINFKLLLNIVINN